MSYIIALINISLYLIFAIAVMLGVKPVRDMVNWIIRAFIIHTLLAAVIIMLLRAQCN